MSKDYEVGYGKPPRKHQFKPGNQAARGKKKERSQTLSIPEILHEALNRRRKIKRGDQIVSMKAGEIMIERLVQMMVSGPSRDLTSILGMIEKHAPRLLEQQAMQMMITYQKADGSRIAPPPDDLWGTEK